MGAHGHRREGRASRRELRVGLAVVLAVGIATLAAVIWMWPSDVAANGEPPLPQVDGTIAELDREPCPEELPDEVNGCGSAVVRVTEGPDAGSSVQVALPNGTGAPAVDDGDDVILVLSTTPDGESYSIVDHQRASGLWMVAAAFALALVAFGRWRGVTALAGLGVTFAVLVFFVVPAIVAGEPPLLVAIVGSAAIMLTVLYLTHGFGAATTVAVLGTLISLTLTGLLSAASVTALHLTGVTDDLSAAVGTTQQVNTQGLLLAGIVIGSLGVLDDVTVTQAATVTELARANPLSRAGELYRAGSRVGRAHIASVVNTVVLAYAGSSLPLLILVVTAGDTLGAVVTDQVIAQEIVRSAVATLGLVAAVPVTTGLAALVAAGGPGSRRG